MSDDIPAEMRPLANSSPSGELTVLYLLGGLLAVVGIAVSILGLNVGGDASLFAEFGVEDLAQKIALTVIGVGIGVTGFLAVFIAMAVTALQKKR